MDDFGQIWMILGDLEDLRSGEFGGFWPKMDNLEAFSTLKLPPLEGVRGKICEICEFRGYRRASFGYI
jgi:hypothetical protein